MTIGPAQGSFELAKKQSERKLAQNEAADHEASGEGHSHNPAEHTVGMSGNWLRARRQRHAQDSLTSATFTSAKRAPLFGSPDVPLCV